MPKTKDGWTLDDSPIFTPEQWKEIQELIKLGKKEEAKKLLEKILSDQSQDGRKV